MPWFSSSSSIEQNFNDNNSDHPGIVESIWINEESKEVQNIGEPIM